MSYFELFLSNRKLLTFGILLTFFSGFGKTFLISLYVPYFISEFELSKTSFSAIYAVATIASGICILYLGALIDQTKLKYYTLMVAVGLIASCILLNVSYNIWFLTLGIFGLRLAGQGLMIHTSVTAITKYFRRCRGKAVSIALLGHPLGEAILPGIVAILISIIGWRATILYSGDFMALILLPMVLFLLRKKPKVVEVVNKEAKAKTKKTSVKKVDKDIEWSIGTVLRDKRFYFIAPSVFCLAGLNAALMFYMIPIAESKGWSAEWMAISFVGFALGNSSATLGVGPIIDKFRASRLFPFYILPLALALIVILVFSDPVISVVYLALSGFAIGAGVNVESAMIAETYGTKSYGKVRTIFTTMNIFSTSLGPFVMALVLDAGVNYNSIFVACIALILFSGLLALNVFPQKIEFAKTFTDFMSKLHLKKQKA